MKCFAIWGLVAQTFAYPFIIFFEMTNWNLEFRFTLISLLRYPSNIVCPIWQRFQGAHFQSGIYTYLNYTNNFKILTVPSIWLNKKLTRWQKNLDKHVILFFLFSLTAIPQSDSQSFQLQLPHGLVCWLAKDQRLHSWRAQMCFPTSFKGQANSCITLPWVQMHR